MGRMECSFDPRCTRCPRLNDFLARVRERHPDYHAAPVAPFGDPQARLLVVGLAPGMHGANATGRPFTGDHAGILLYETLHRFGFSNRPDAVALDDGLELRDCRITNAVKCLPPENRPQGAEVANCNPYLASELRSLPGGAVVLALGTLAHNAVLRAVGRKVSAHRFAHGAEHEFPELTLVDSYHCSRYNTQTRRLTPDMFGRVFERIKDRIPPLGS